MQVTETLSDGLKRGFTVVVPAADIETRRTARLTDLSKTIAIPGFRPGKVPVQIVRQRFGNAVNVEVLEQSVDEATRKVLEERGLRPAQQPKVDLVNADTGRTASDLEFKVELEVLPEIPMPDFAAISLTRLKAEVPEQDVDKALAEMAERNRTLEEIPPEELGDRGAARGEILTVDYKGRIDDQPFPGGTGEDIDVEVGGSGFIPGFTDQLEGMRPGETRTIEATFPEEYGVKELAGKPASFDITAKKLRRAQVPALDDAFAQRFAYDDLNELRDFMRRRLEEQNDALSRLRLKRQLLDALSERVDFPAPQGMVDLEFGQIWQRLEDERKQGRLDEDDKDKDEDTLRADYRAIAERRVKLGLLLAEIARRNNITVPPEEINRGLRLEAMRYGNQAEKMYEFFRQNQTMQDYVRGPLFEQKVCDYVLELAQVTDQTVTPEELREELPVAVPSGAGGSQGAAAPQPGVGEGGEPAPATDSAPGETTAIPPGA